MERMSEIIPSPFTGRSFSLLRHRQAKQKAPNVGEHSALGWPVG